MIFEVSKLLPKNQITLPKEVRKALDVSIGDKVAFVETNEGLYVKKVDETAIRTFIIGSN